MKKNRTAYITQYKKDKGLKRVVIEVPENVKDEIIQLAKKSGCKSVNEYVLSHLPLTTYQPNKFDKRRSSIMKDDNKEE